LCESRTVDEKVRNIFIYLFLRFNHKNFSLPKKSVPLPPPVCVHLREIEEENKNRKFSRISNAKSPKKTSKHIENKESIGA